MIEKELKSINGDFVIHVKKPEVKSFRHISNFGRPIVRPISQHTNAVSNQETNGISVYCFDVNKSTKYILTINDDDELVLNPSCSKHTKAKPIIYKIENIFLKFNQQPFKKGSVKW
jgi:hypothetical protein